MKKRILASVLILVLALSFAGCSKKSQGDNPDTPAVIDKAPEDMTASDVMEIYCKVYDTSKATGAVLGVNSMQIPRIVFDGKQNKTVEGMVGKLINSLFEKQTGKPLPPSEQAESLDTCLLTGEDVEEATYTDNGDGTGTIHFVPKGVHFPECEKDPQGKTFNLFADLKASIGGVKQVTWAQGNIDENLDVYYHDGYVDCTFDTKTFIITKATYVSSCDLTLNHANFMGIIKDKSVEITLQYIEQF